MGRLQAIGQLRYGPRASTVDRKGRWLAVECDRDWFHMYAPQVHREMPGRWMQAVDRDRARMDSRGRVDPRLGIVKPIFQEPAWGPHISVSRGERFTEHLDVWDLGVEMGDVRQEITSMRLSRRHYEAQAVEFEQTLARMSPGVRPKYRKAAEDSLAGMRAKVADRAVRLVRLERRESVLLERWERLRASQGLPEWLTPGGPIQFGYSPDLKLAGSHWYLDVKSRTLGRLRTFFGLPVRPRVPFHLTVGVTGG